MTSLEQTGGGPIVLVANRGEIAIRICRAIAEVGWKSVVVFAEDDADHLHVRKGDISAALGGRGAAAYLNADRLLEIASEHGCTMVHPGYGFLSESAEFARCCEDAGLNFVGPRPATLATFGDKNAARRLADKCGIPLPAGTGILNSAGEAADFLAERGPRGAILLKALAGGGGRGIRILRAGDDLSDAFDRCRSEARSSFGDDRVYAEELIESARHIEVQVVGDGAGDVAVIGERECSLQRRQQKIIEIAPSPGLSGAMRARLYGAASAIARQAGYRGLGTVEFLVRESDGDDRFWFLEVNPRLQVEHTITEETAGIDLVQLQFRIALGEVLANLDLPDPLRSSGRAIQLRINTEIMQADGTALPALGTLSVLELPAGPGIRTDSAAFVGFRNALSYDSLLAKLIVHTRSSDFGTLLRKAYRALCETRIEGIDTNLGLLRELLRHPDVVADRVDTRFLDRHLVELLRQRHDHPEHVSGNGAPAPEVTLSAECPEAPEDAVVVSAPTNCRVVEINVKVGDLVRLGQQLAVTEAMKMETVIGAPADGVVLQLAAAPNDTLTQGAPILFLLKDETAVGTDAGVNELLPADPDAIRADLAAVVAAHEKLTDAARPDAVVKRRKTGQRTARENVAHLCDPGSFMEYGGLAVAARHRRYTLPELQEKSPADGLITGTATVNAPLFGEENTRVAVMAYDYTVYAGTQGFFAHVKKRRLLRIASKWRLPIILFGEGGGGRPGDTDDLSGLKFYNPTFWALARLNGVVPIVAVVSGPCFAGNAALIACANIVIAAADASIGMGGPAMIEGGGLGTVAARDVGPVSVQAANGLVDVVVPDEAGGVEAARQFMGYVQGRRSEWSCPDQRLLRTVVPEAPRRGYDMREVIGLLADEGSVMELKRDFGTGIITSLIRIEGHAFAVLANNPSHLAGAIDAEAAEKAARFCALVETLQLPLLKLCDTPGFMVGPEAERNALVRRAGEMFVGGSKLSVPEFVIVVRKAYGLGAVAMFGGNAFEQVFAVSWPTGHFGKMGLEGSVKLSHRQELAELPDDAARQARVRELVDELHNKGLALNAAPFLTIDDVIDPMESRRWLVSGLQLARYRKQRQAQDDLASAREPFDSAWHS